MRLILFITFLFSSSLYSQTTKIYRTSGGELILSRSVSNSPFENTTSRIRASAFFHYNNNFHFDISHSLGFYSGLSISNIGFSYESADTVFKRRTYNIGVPLAIKFGNMRNLKYLFAGGELEFPIHYKQKKIYDDEKIKQSSFFDKRTNPFLISIFAGIQFPEGFSFKIRYYLSDFLNTDFVGKDFGKSMSYKNIDTKLFMISLSFNFKENKIKMREKDTNRYAYLNI